MRRNPLLIVFAHLSILLAASFGMAQEAGHEEPGDSVDHGGRSHYLNEFAIFLGGATENGHSTQLTWGLDYKRRVADRWAVGLLFNYASGSLRNAIVATSVSWSPVGKLSLMAAPGIAFHQGSGARWACGCGGTLPGEEPGEPELIDEDARYFVFRLGVGWDFQIGKSSGIQPQVNLDLVDGEKVWVYGVNFTFAW
ncbi:MAG: autotransporter outer membrane beta-barrel domain-containing protein [Thermoanaerobaculales bacterium]|nr:autotransporter outer membrane beta-barrel domain-containing protein [Thermoanaerobaculales bacterium]